MKKISLFLTGAMMFLIAAALVFPPQPAKPMPENLKALFKASCMACHSDDGGVMAKSRVNFSKWDSYDLGKQLKKAADISKVVKSGTMPPKSFAKANPGAVLTDAQKEIILKWSDNLNQGK